MSNGEGTVVSDDAELTVVTDGIAPTLMTAAAASATRVDILFSEAVSVSSAETIANYQMNLGTDVTAAKLDEEGRTVSLTVSALSEDTTYEISVSNVQDRAPRPNTLTTQSTTFAYRAADDFEDGNANGWTPLTANRWEVKQDIDGDNAYWLKITNFGSPDNGQLGEYSLLPGEYSDFTFTAQARLADDVSGTANASADYAVVFGYQDDEESYYYAMFNNNPAYTQLFKVIRGVRGAALATASQDWLTDNAYHSIEVSRAGSVIIVLFDGEEVMRATDNSLGAGRVGVGSFNDSAYFDDVSVTGAAATVPGTNPPSTPSTPRVIIITNH